MGTLLRRCVEVRTVIELSFGVVSGVGPSIHVPQREGAVSGMVSGIFRNLRPILYSREVTY